MNCLVIGYGSIGARHARLLNGLGCDTAVVSSRDVDFPNRYRDLASALETHTPHYVVIANSTHLHHETLRKLIRLGYAGTILVEKPLFDRDVTLEKPWPEHLSVAYNLRFHPVIQRLRTLLRNENVLSVQAYAGQFLPTWRPGSDYRDGYSAKAEQGGGALRDLSHELDYLLWILGGWKSVTALGGHESSLEISSDDVFALLLATNRCPAVSIQLNYLDRVGRRSLIVNADRHTFEADLVRGTLTIDGDTEAFTIERDQTYVAMHSAALGGRAPDLCTLEEGMETMHLIVAAERAVRDRTWVRR